MPASGDPEGYLFVIGLILTATARSALGVAGGDRRPIAMTLVDPSLDLDRIVRLADFEPLARAALDPAAYDYIAGGSWDEDSLAESEAAWRRRTLRPRVLVDVADVSTRRRRCSACPASLPVAIAPMAAHGLVHPDGELATARAAAAAGIPFILSTMSSRVDRGGRRGDPRCDALVPALRPGGAAPDAAPRRASGRRRLRGDRR